jgi:uncharacterized Zn finger protein
MTPGAADEARRALREAREAGEGQEPGAAKAPAQAQGSEGSGDAGARPGDVARAALRRAVSARRGGDERAAGAVSADASDTDVTHVPDASDIPDVSNVSPKGTSGTAESRPADVAREALRAARADSRQARIDAEQTGGRAERRSQRPAPPGDGTRGSGPRRAAGARARDLRELLADSFRMPGSETSPTPAPDGDQATRERSSGPRASTPGAASAAAGHSEPGTAAPHSMAAPSRDGELRRTFPAFPPGASAGAAAPFAGTWWGNAWVTALEEGALDAKRLARGRSYAQQGHVDAITVTPGLVLAYVQGSRPRPYRVQVRLRTLDDAEWARFLDAAAERPGHIAALLDKELPQSLADCAVPLLPGPRDLEPHCSCPDRGHPCKHAAALCYQTARLLDADPFVLLLLRGRGERELLDALSRLSAARAARAAQEQQPAPFPGVRAAEAVAARRLPPLPPPLPVPPHPGQPPVYPAAPGGPDPFALDQLATDAAARAHTLLATGRDPVAELTLWQDAVRLAAARPGSGLTAGTRALYATLASAADRTPAELARAVAAWRQGGLAGLAALEEPWDPPAGRFDRARPLLLAADLPAFRPWRNHLTHPRGHVQLRLGRDGLWYAYESEPGHDDWWPRGTPDLDPVGALTGLGTPDDL